MQKKRRKRQIAENIAVDGHELCWELISEPQYTSEHGYRGVRIRVWMSEGTHRELILEYPFPPKRRIAAGGTTIAVPPGFPLRPKVSAKAVADDIRRAIADGWNPQSRGKPRTFMVPPNTN